jgi:hypothetical protein
LVGFPAAAGNIATDDAFHRNHVQFTAFHAFAGKFRAAEKFGHISRIYGDHVVGNNVLGEVEPEFGHLGQYGTLVRNGVFQNMVEGRDPVRSYHNQAVADIVNLPNFPGFKRFVFLHDPSSLKSRNNDFLPLSYHKEGFWSNVFQRFYHNVCLICYNREHIRPLHGSYWNGCGKDRGMGIEIPKNGKHCSEIIF